MSVIVWESPQDAGQLPLARRLLPYSASVLLALGRTDWYQYGQQVHARASIDSGATWTDLDGNAGPTVLMDDPQIVGPNTYTPRADLGYAAVLSSTGHLWVASGAERLDGGFSPTHSGTWMRLFERTGATASGWALTASWDWAAAGVSYTWGLVDSHHSAASIGSGRTLWGWQHYTGTSYVWRGGVKSDSGNPSAAPRFGSDSTGVPSDTGVGAVAVTSDGALHQVFARHRSGNTTWEWVHRSGADAGGESNPTWNAETVITTQSSTTPNPYMAVCALGTQLHLVARRLDLSPDAWQHWIYSGGTWSPGVDVPLPSGNVWQASLAATPDGRLVLTSEAGGDVASCEWDGVGWSAWTTVISDASVLYPHAGVLQAGLAGVIAWSGTDARFQSFAVGTAPATGKFNAGVFNRRGVPNA